MNPNASQKDNNGEDGCAPKKRKLFNTSKYIYKTLFKEQKNSDVRVMMLDKVWKLHKVYLCQSPYFYSMFNGSWEESNQDFVHIQILDEHITPKSLNDIFGAMYSDEIEIDPESVISVLATATLFHLDSIIEQCAEVMIGNIDVENAVLYYEIACRYGSLSVKKVTYNWFLINLLGIYSERTNLLRQLSIDLMTSLVGDPNLYVVETEFALYKLLRTWMFLQLHPNYDPDDPEEKLLAEKEKQLLIDTGICTSTQVAVSDVVPWSYFLKRTGERAFLATPEGESYVRTFQNLRAQYLIILHRDFKIIFNDNVLPKEWLYNHALRNWNSVLKVDHALEQPGPHNLDHDIFLKHCKRSGGLLLKPDIHVLHWIGFNFGLDLMLILEAQTLRVRRAYGGDNRTLLGIQKSRKFMIRTSVTSINAQRQPVFTQTSEIVSLDLEKYEYTTLMLLDSKLEYPLVISVNMLVVHPSDEDFLKILAPASSE